MKYIYIAMIVLSTVSGIADIVLRYMEKIKRFGLDKSFFFFKEHLIPIHRFVPNSLTQLILFVFSSGVFGLFSDNIGFTWYFSLPISFCTGSIVIYIFNSLCLTIDKKRNSCVLPKGDNAAELSGTCIEKIEGDGYGKVNFTYNNHVFVKNAVSANETDIEVGTVVIAVYENDDLYIVEKYSEIFDILNEK